MALFALGPLEHINWARQMCIALTYSDADITMTVKRMKASQHTPVGQENFLRAVSTEISPNILGTGPASFGSVRSDIARMYLPMQADGWDANDTLMAHSFEADKAVVLKGMLEATGNDMIAAQRAYQLLLATDRA